MATNKEDLLVNASTDKQINFIEKYNQLVDDTFSLNKNDFLDNALVNEDEKIYIKNLFGKTIPSEYFQGDSTFQNNDLSASNNMPIDHKYLFVYKSTSIQFTFDIFLIHDVDANKIRANIKRKKITQSISGETITYEYTNVDILDLSSVSYFDSSFIKNLNNEYCGMKYDASNDRIEMYFYFVSRGYNIKSYTYDLSDDSITNVDDVSGTIYTGFAAGADNYSITYISSLNRIILSTHFYDAPTAQRLFAFDTSDVSTILVTDLTSSISNQHFIYSNFYYYLNNFYIIGYSTSISQVSLYELSLGGSGTSISLTMNNICDLSDLSIPYSIGGVDNKLYLYVRKFVTTENNYNVSILGQFGSTVGDIVEVINFSCNESSEVINDPITFDCELGDIATSGDKYYGIFNNENKTISVKNLEDNYVHNFYVKNQEILQQKFITDTSEIDFLRDCYFKETDGVSKSYSYFVNVDQYDVKIYFISSKNLLCFNERNGNEILIDEYNDEDEMLLSFKTNKNQYQPYGFYDKDNEKFFKI